MVSISCKVEALTVFVGKTNVDVGVGVVGPTALLESGMLMKYKELLDHVEVGAVMEDTGATTSRNRTQAKRTDRIKRLASLNRAFIFHRARA